MEFSIIGCSASIDNVPYFLSSIRSVSSANKTIIQAMDASRIAGENHVKFAINKALRAIENNSNVAKDTGIEIMRYASGKRQIEEAFSMGIHEGEMDLVFVILGDKNDVEQSAFELKSMIKESQVIEYTESKKTNILDQFSITKKEIEAVGEEMIPFLVIERVALVDIMK